MSEDNLLEFTVPEWAISPLINGDNSALNDKEINQLDRFVNDTVEEYGNANFMLTDDMEPDFLHSNDIDNMAGNCYTLNLFKTN